LRKEERPVEVEERSKNLITFRAGFNRPRKRERLRIAPATLERISADNWIVLSNNIRFKNRITSRNTPILAIGAEELSREKKEEIGRI
jgi:hypothetical protein